MVADLCSKSAGVHLLGIESTDGAEQCLKLVGSVADVTFAAEQGVALAKKMGTTAFYSVMASPLEETSSLADSPP